MVSVQGPPFNANMPTTVASEVMDNQRCLLWILKPIMRRKYPRNLVVGLPLFLRSEATSKKKTMIP
jgi:hypothetical protein